ncbi:MAG: hypothetical protein ACHQ9S_23770 [Candidatus Binatia bacterium]
MPNFRNRLTRAQQRIYDRSNATASVPLRPTSRLRAAVSALPGILLSADRARVEQVSQFITDEISMVLRVVRVRIIVSGTRPSNARGELHGLYTPSSRREPATIKVWMMTAKRGQIVAFKTYLRTLLHEIGHHLDYALLRLPESFHTDGFYRRESSLFYQIAGETVGARRAVQPEAPVPSATAARAQLQ